jgi:hypothetical protein
MSSSVPAISSSIDPISYKTGQIAQKKNVIHQASDLRRCSVIPIRVHDTTLPHLDLYEKILLDELLRQGRAVIVSENQTVRSNCGKFQGERL